MFTCFTFPWPLSVAFDSTLTCDPHHNLQHPSRSLETSIWCFHVVTFGTIVTFTSPLLHVRDVWVVFTCFTFPWPLRVAFASTLTCDPHHNLQHPSSSLETSIWCFHVVTFGTFVTFTSPLLHFRDVWVVFTCFTFPPRRFCFHTDL